MNARLAFWVFLAVAGQAHAQVGVGYSPAKNDSALHALHRQFQAATNDTTRIILLEKLSDVYLNKAKPDSALVLLQRALQLARQSKRPLDLGRTYRGLGTYYFLQLLPSQQIEANRKAIYYLKEAKRIPEATEVMYQLAKVYVDYLEPAKAVEQIQKNIAYAQQTGYYGRLAPSYGLLYNIHIRLGKKQAAFADLKAMERIPALLRNDREFFVVNSYFADWFERQGDHAKGLTYRERALLLIREVGTPVEIIQVYESIATNLLNQKAYSQAETYLNKGIRIANQTNRPAATLYNRLALLREGQNRLPEAYRAARKAYDDIRRVNNPYLLFQVLNTLGRLQEKQGEYKQALATFNEFKTLSDSLNEVKKARAISLVESRFSLQRKEKDIMLLRKNASIQRLELQQVNQRIILYTLLTAGLVVVLLLMGRMVHLNRRNMHLLNRQKAEISAQLTNVQALNQVKNKLFSIIGHDLRAPVIHLKLLVDAFDTTPQSAAAMARQTDQLKRTINPLYHLLDNLLHWAALQQGGLRRYPQQTSLSDLVTETVALFDSIIIRKNIAVRVESGQVCTWADEGQVQIVIRNIIHNALKFTPPNGHVWVSFSQSTTETVIRIADTGTGMTLTHWQQPAESHSKTGTMGEPGTGLGLLICDEFMKHNGGRLEIDSTPGKGTVVRLIFGMNQIEKVSKVRYDVAADPA